MEQQQLNDEALGHALELMESLGKGLDRQAGMFLGIALMPTIMKRVKKENPEAYYSMKTKLRNFHATMSELLPSLAKDLEEL